MGQVRVAHSFRNARLRDHQPFHVGCQGDIRAGPFSCHVIIGAAAVPVAPELMHPTRGTQVYLCDRNHVRHDLAPIVVVAEPGKVMPTGLQIISVRSFSIKITTLPGLILRRARLTVDRLTAGHYFGQQAQALITRRSRNSLCSTICNSNELSPAPAIRKTVRLLWDYMEGTHCGVVSPTFIHVFMSIPDQVFTS